MAQMDAASQSFSLSTYQMASLLRKRVQTCDFGSCILSTRKFIFKYHRILRYGGLDPDLGMILHPIPSHHPHDMCKMCLRTRCRGAARSESHLMLQILRKLDAGFKENLWQFRWLFSWLGSRFCGRPPPRDCLTLGSVSPRIRCWVSSPLEWPDCSGASTSDLFWFDVGLDMLSCSDVFTCYGGLVT
jgi:hypothetical protein